MQRKCYILVVTQELVLCLICPPSALKALFFRASGLLFRQTIRTAMCYNCKVDNLKKSKFKKFYQVFSIISLNLYRYTANLIKNLEGVQLCRLILRLLNALFILYLQISELYSNCTI